MKTQFDVEKLIASGKIENELELERAFIAERKLRLLSKEDAKLKLVRKKLRDLIEAYEMSHWSAQSEITDEKLRESDLAESIADQESIFISKRKQLIKSRLSEFGLNQQQLGVLLGHNSKSYMSELMNGICPFSLKDLVVINRLFKIEFSDLIPAFLPQNECEKIKDSLAKLDKPALRLSTADFRLIK